jgi:hypothetical protein
MTPRSYYPIENRCLSVRQPRSGPNRITLIQRDLPDELQKIYLFDHELDWLVGVLQMRKAELDRWKEKR